MTETPTEPKASESRGVDWASYLSLPIVSGKWAAIAGLLVAAGVLVFFVRPWEVPQELPEDNTALAWNAAIGRLGIQPLYPPQEDFLVGDIYISLADPETEVGGERVRYPSNVFRGRSVRIARIDLRANIRNGVSPYRFSDRQEVAGQANVAGESPGSPTGTETSDAIDLTLVSSPGLTVRRHMKAEAGFWGYFAGRRTGETEEISIKSTTTYGAPAVEAMVALQGFCVDEKTSPVCNDAAARRILGYAFGSEVSSTYKDQYIFPIRISIISQVFLTRDLKVNRYRGDVLDLNGKPDAADDTSSTANTVDQQADAGPASEARYKSMQANRMDLDDDFTRPLAFGFRAISFALPRSKPPVTKGQ